MGLAPLERTRLMSHRSCAGRRRLIWAIAAGFAGCAHACAQAESEAPRSDLIVVQGAGGATEYETAFAEWSEAWRQSAQGNEMQLHAIGPGTSEVPDRDVLHETLTRLSQQPSRPLWLVLIGHGTFFQGDAKFNLTGQDVSAEELAEWLRPLDRPVAVINCASCSAPFIDRLSGPDRVVVTATRSGAEMNYARFGQYLAEAIGSERTDIDHDGTISLLEVFLSASSRTQSFYRDEGRLATEHALLDDNGDRMGTSAEFFRGIYVTGQPQGTAAVDGLKAHQWTVARLADAPQLSAEQLKRRDELESSINALRQRKEEMAEDDYYQQLEPHLIELARLYGQAAD
jgi:hypothetical protein